MLNSLLMFHTKVCEPLGDVSGCKRPQPPGIKHILREDFNQLPR